MQNGNTSLLKSGLDVQKKYTPINIAVGKYIKALCKMLKVDFKETFPNAYPVYKLIPFPDIPTKVVLNNYMLDNENFHASENQTPAIDNDLAEKYINSLLSPIREKSSIKKKKIDRLSRSLKGIINSPDKETSSDTEENVVIDGGIMSLFYIFTSIYKNTLAAVSKTDLINEKVKPYFISIFANPLTTFVYDEKNQIYVWVPINNKYPEKLDLSNFLANNITNGKSFLNALCHLLKEYNKILIKDNGIIRNYYIYTYLQPYSYYLYVQKNKMLMQKVTQEYHNLSIDEKISYDKINEMINKINHFLKENEKSLDIINISTYSLDVHIIDMDGKLRNQIIFYLPSERSNIGFTYFNTSYDPYAIYYPSNPYARKFIYDTNIKENSSLPAFLGLSSVKQNIFSACSYVKRFIYTCNLIIQLIGNCSVYQGNIIYISPSSEKIQNTKKPDYCKCPYLLNEFLFIAMKSENILINYNSREKETLVRIYDCIFNWITNEPMCTIENLPETYKQAKNLEYIIDVYTSQKKQIIGFIAFLTNKNYYILYCFIRIFKSIYNMEVYKRKGYIFLNCSEKIFSLYKKFFSIFNNKCRMDNGMKLKSELKSTSELNNYNCIPMIIKASYGYTPIFVNRITNSSTNNVKKLLSGAIIKNQPAGRLNKDGFSYGRFYCKNNVPILIYSDDEKNTHKFISELKDHLYKLDFKNMEISDEEFENCSKFINSLDSNLIEYIVACFSNYDGSPEDEQFDNETSAITDKECVIKFVKDCYKSSKNSIVFTADIYEIYKKYAYNELGISESNIDSATFSKYFKEASKAESKRTNKGRGYINISINYDAEPIIKDKLIEMKATREARENTAFNKLLNAIFS